MVLTSILNKEFVLLANETVFGSCVLTHDSIYLKCHQSKVFQLVYLVLFFSFLVSAFYNPIFFAGLFCLVYLCKNPIFTEFYFQFGIGEQYKFHFSIPFFTFRLFCVNGHFFSVPGFLANDVKTRLQAFKDLQND